MRTIVGLKVSSKDFINLVDNPLVKRTGYLSTYNDRFNRQPIYRFKQISDTEIACGVTSLDIEFSLYLLASCINVNVGYSVELEVMGLEHNAPDSKERIGDCIYAVQVRYDNALYIGSIRRKQYPDIVLSESRGGVSSPGHISWELYAQKQDTELYGDEVIYCGDDYECDNYVDVLTSLPPSSRQCFNCGLPPEQHKAWLENAENHLQQEQQQAQEEDECEAANNDEVIEVLMYDGHEMRLKILKGVKDGIIYSFVEGYIQEKKYDNAKKRSYEYDMYNMMRNTDGTRRQVEMKGENGEHWRGTFEQLLDGNEKLVMTRTK